ncbi:MAG: heavy metal translocating P-type ATPase [Lachnospiraceae bacterium]|nr:heavy metal translocating P-type ATPase [Lachnospiraceae bacterium]
MEKYRVTGMSCAACSAHVEKAVSNVKGVTQVSVSLLTNSMSVEGTASHQDVINAVTASGYGASVMGNEMADTGGQSDIGEDTDKETKILKIRFAASLCFLVPLMYISMGHMMWNWKLPKVLENNHLSMGLAQMLLTIMIMVINQKFFISGIKSFLNRSPNMDTLVALGAGASFVYSTFALFAMSDAIVVGNMNLAESYMHEFYFESSAMILTLITLGKTLESYSKGRTTDALKSLMKLSPKMAVVERQGEMNSGTSIEVQIPASEVQIGDIFVVRPGDSIPVDGVVLEGSSAVDEAALTGESVPVDKQEGDTVSAATINKSGYMKCRATRVGEDTTLSKIIQMVSDAAATKAPIAKVADKVSGIFVPIVIVTAFITMAVWLIAGKDFGFALTMGVSVLVISCPCGLGLATPVAIMVGNGMGAKNGILFKTASSLEQAGKVKTVVLDKTGTITSGHPKVTEVIADKNVSKEELLKIAYSIEKKSEHPLAEAIVQYGNEIGICEYQVDNFKNIPGSGLEGVVLEKPVKAGSLRFIKEWADVSDDMMQYTERISEDGKTPLLFALDKKVLGIIAVADVIKEDSPEAVKELQDMGIEVVMLTGDNKKTADAVGKQAGVDNVIAGVLPDGKEEVIRNLSESGMTAMVGDGINDAPALTRAHVGIAIGAGTDVAIDAADVVLMKSTLMDVPASIKLGKAVLKNIHQNLFWAFFYNVVGIPLAAGVLYPVFGLKLNPMFGAAAMSLSSFCVVTNALRLNLVKLYNNTNIKNERREVVKMEKTMEIKGMMCGHCEARVKKCLEALDMVSAAEVSHEKGTAVVTLSGEIDDELLKKAVEEQDYQVISIK